MARHLSSEKGSAVSGHAIDEIVRKLDGAFGHSDLEAVLRFHEDDAVLVVQPGPLLAVKKRCSDSPRMSLP
jgi:ketosteroid isomerase-like protein